MTIMAFTQRRGDFLNACGRAAVCVIMTLSLTTISLPASATDLDWSLSGDGYHQVRKVKHRKPKVRYYAAPKVDDGWRCLERIHVVGSQWATDAGAEDSAKKAFMEEVRWRHGESFMAIENAKDYEKRCSRSSVGEVLNQTLVRCEISARPCRPPMTAGK
jgi:hypothetical protein